MTLNVDSEDVTRDFSLQGISILVVQDTDEFRLFISNYLSLHGAIVFSAENGLAGLELFKKHEIDVVITDIRMPVMDGLEMTAAIRKSDHKTPIIFLSVDTDDLYLFTDGFTDSLHYLKTKPGVGVLLSMLAANPNALLSELHTWLEKLSPEQRTGKANISEIKELLPSESSQEEVEPDSLIPSVNESDLIANLSVLFAAHHCDARDYLIEFLEQRVGKLYIATNGEEGLGLFERHRPQLVIASVGMRGMGGLEMAEKIRNHNPDVQIILINNVETWSYQENKLLTLLKLAGNKFLAKPLTNDGLLEAIQYCLDQYECISDMSMSASAFMIAPLAMVITDAHKTVVTVNPAFTVASGYRMEEVKGRDISLFCSAKDNEAVFSQMWHSLDSKGRWSGEIRSRRKNGNLVKEWVTVTAVYDWKNRLANYVLVFSDVAQRSLAEEKLHHIIKYNAGKANG